MEEIDAAMDRITTMSKERHGVGGSVDGSGKNVRDSGRSDQYHPQHRQHDHRQQLLHPPREDDDDFDVVNYHHHDDRHNGARRRYSPPPPPPPPHPSVQSTVLPQQSPYDNGYTTTRYRNHGSGTFENDHHHRHQHQPHHSPWEGDGGGRSADGGASVGGSSWVGGFSLGVVGLAAWRWLNGGDFVLFPPTSIISSTTTYSESTLTTSTTRGGGSVNNHDNGTKSADVAKEEGVTTKAVSWKGLPSCTTEEVDEEEGDDEDYNDQGDDAEASDEEDNGVDEIEYYDDDEVEEEEDDDFLDSHDLHSILNHKNSNTTHSHRRYPQPPPPSQHPSYDELVVEIRALTSAIHSHRDSQERIARNAYNTNVGKGMTDDAMDFLRKKREENNNINVVDVLRQDNSFVVATLLKEVSGDLYELKQTMNLTPMEGGNQECITELGTMEGSVEEGSKEVEKGEEAVSDVEGPSEQIDVVIEKIQKLLAIVDEKPKRNVGGDISILENGNDNNNEDGDAGGCTETVIGEGDSKVMSASTELGIAQMSASVVPTESIASREVADLTTADESGLLALEEHHINESVSLPTRETSPTNLPQQQEQQQQQHQLEDALRKLANNNDAQQLKFGAQMLYLYCRNISQNASVPRYRKIYTNNNTFRNKLGNLVGAKDFLVAVGFVEHAKENLYEWSDQVGGGECTEAEIKSKLDFALVALELMKNGGGSGDVLGGGNPPS